MPNTPRTPHRTVRVDDALWEAAGHVAERSGTDRGTVIRAFLRWYTRTPGAELPQPSEEVGSP